MAEFDPIFYTFNNGHFLSFQSLFTGYFSIWYWLLKNLNTYSFLYEFSNAHKIILSWFNSIPHYSVIWDESCWSIYFDSFSNLNCLFFELFQATELHDWIQPIWVLKSLICPSFFSKLKRYTQQCFRTNFSGNDSQEKFDKEG